MTRQTRSQVPWAICLPCPERRINFIALTSQTPYRLTMIFLLGFLLITLSPVESSTPHSVVPTDTTTSVWQNDLISKISFSQLGFQNWEEGGLNTLSTVTGLEGKITRDIGSWAQTYEINLSFGFVKQDTLNLRKANDVIRLRSSLQYQGDGFFKILNPTLASEIRTQFADGFNYKKNPFGDGRKPPVKVSDFLAPAIFSQSLGLTYVPGKWFTQRMGIGAKETVVRHTKLRPLYKLSPDQLVRFELGAESRTKVDWEVFENVRYKTSLGLFAAFNKPDLPDLLWENEIVLQVNAWLHVSLEYAALYDRDLGSQLQMKEMLAVGLSYAIM